MWAGVVRRPGRVFEHVISMVEESEQGSAPREGQFRVVRNGWEWGYGVLLCYSLLGGSYSVGAEHSSAVLELDPDVEADSGGSTPDCCCCCCGCAVRSRSRDTGTMARGWPGWYDANVDGSREALDRPLARLPPVPVPAPDELCLDLEDDDDEGDFLALPLADVERCDLLDFFDLPPTLAAVDAPVPSGKPVHNQGEGYVGYRKGVGAFADKLERDVGTARKPEEAVVGAMTSA